MAKKRKLKEAEAAQPQKKKVKKSEKQKKEETAKEEKKLAPQDPVNYSCNWRKMMETLPQKKKKSDSKPAEKKETKPEIWFDDVDDIFLDEGKAETATSTSLVKNNAYTGTTKVVAMDCEFVGVGKEGEDSVLARASIVNSHGHCVYDKFVKANEPITDYRTAVSGIRKEDMEKGEDFKVVQKEVGDLIKGKLLVGHAIMNDLKVLYLGHPKKMIRDTSRFKLFKKACGTKRPSLKKLSERVLKVKVQTGEHNSVEDAQAAMRLYTMYKQKWEKEIREKKNTSAKKVKLKKE